MPNLRLDDDVKAFAQVVQRRRREAAERVKSGEIVHLNFLGVQACFDKAVSNLSQLEAKVGPASEEALADVVNYGLAVIAKALPIDESAEE